MTALERLEATEKHLDALGDAGNSIAAVWSQHLRTIVDAVKEVAASQTAGLDPAVADKVNKTAEALLQIAAKFDALDARVALIENAISQIVASSKEPEQPAA